MVRGPNRHFPNKAYDSKEAPEKIVNITNLQRNADKNDKEVSPHTGWNGYHQKICKQYILERMQRKGTLL